MIGLLYWIHINHEIVFTIARNMIIIMEETLSKIMLFIFKMLLDIDSMID